MSRIRPRWGTVCRRSRSEYGQRQQSCEDEVSDGHKFLCLWSCNNRLLKRQFYQPPPPGGSMTVAMNEDTPTDSQFTTAFSHTVFCHNGLRISASTGGESPAPVYSLPGHEPATQSNHRPWEVIAKYGERYGGMSVMWLFNQPSVVLHDARLMAKCSSVGRRISIRISSAGRSSRC